MLGTQYVLTYNEIEPAAYMRRLRKACVRLFNITQELGDDAISVLVWQSECQ
jgi:hypothetical protein